MHSIEGALRMTDEINAQFGFERAFGKTNDNACLLYTSPSPRDTERSRMPSSA